MEGAAASAGTLEGHVYYRDRREDEVGKGAVDVRAVLNEMASCVFSRLTFVDISRTAMITCHHFRSLSKFRTCKG